MNWAEFFSAIPIEVSVAAIGTLSVVISAILSLIISKSATKTEVEAEKEQRKETWEHEREAAYNAEFAEAVTAVSIYLSESSEENLKTALRTLNIVRVKENGELANDLDIIYCYIGGDFSDEEPLYRHQQIEQYLGEAIEQRRKHYHEQNPGDH